MMCDLWSIMMLLWDFTFIATIANVWELWSLSDFYDMSWLCYESIWYVKVYFSQYDHDKNVRVKGHFSHHVRKGYEAPIGSLVITRLKWTNPMMCYVMLWSLMSNELMMTLVVNG